MGRLRLRHHVCGVVEYVVSRNHALILDRQVNDGYEFGSVSRVTFPHTVCQSLTLLVGVFVVCVYFCLELCNEILVRIVVVFV